MSFLRTFFLIFFPLTSFIACSKKHQNWDYMSISTGYKEYDTSRLVYPKSSYLHDMEIEFVYSENTLTAYINVFSKPVPLYENNPNLTLLTISSSEGVHEMICDRLKGGQKIKIPQDSLPLVIDLMEKNSPVTLSLSNFYQLKIQTTGLKKDFNRLKKKNLPLTSNKPLGIAF